MACPIYPVLQTNKNSTSHRAAPSRKSARTTSRHGLPANRLQPVDPSGFFQARRPRRSCGRFTGRIDQDFPGRLHVQ